MSESTRQNAETSSAAFKEGVEAGLNSEKDTKNWKDGNELGQELNAEGETKELVYATPFNASAAPLFVRDREGNKGNAQDEKDETEE